MLSVKGWVDQAVKYPVMEIYGGKDLAQSKEEKRVIAACENVFKLTASDKNEVLPKAEMLAAWRDLEVALIMSGNFPVKESYIKEKKENFLTCAISLAKLMEETYKKEPVLKAYYESWKIKNADMKDLVLHL